jgi:hypothetical protein
MSAFRIAAAWLAVAVLAGPACAAPAPAAADDVVVHAAGLATGSLSEFSLIPDSAAAGGRLAGTPQSGGDLDPPPEDDPNVTFKVQVRGGVPYRCWVRMKVGAPRGVSKANRLWVQLSNAVDAKGKSVLKPGTASYLTAQGPEQQGWVWVAFEADPKSPGTTVTFRSNGEVTVRIQAGMEGVGFDQFVLSPANYLEKAPAAAVVAP